MPNMNATYRNALATYGAGLMPYIGLVDNTGTEISGGDPAYARKEANWTAADNGLIRIGADLAFDIPAGSNVSGWRGYSALTNGTEYGGKSLPRKNAAGQGIYDLFADQTAVDHK